MMVHFTIIVLLISAMFAGCTSTSLRNPTSNASMVTPQKIDGLYVNTYGNHSDQALIFIHGGPGYDSQDFEWSTASALAAKGFFVIVYDQRGQGRSQPAKDPKEYSYQQYADDLKLIISQLKLKKPTLIGHSHDGPIALKFDQFYPGMVSRIILVSAPVNFWRSLESIKINCTTRYATANDSGDSQKIKSAFLTLNGTPSLENEVKSVGEIFQLALSKPCDLYTPSQSTADRLKLHQTIAKLKVPVVNENLFYPMGNFVINDQYIHIDHSQWVRDHATYIFGIYGSEDGLFTPSVLADIQSILSSNPSAYKFQMIKGASHAVYIDRQDQFLDAVINSLK